MITQQRPMIESKAILTDDNPGSDDTVVGFGDGGLCAVLMWFSPGVELSVVPIVEMSWLSSRHAWYSKFTRSNHRSYITPSKKYTVHLHHLQKTLLVWNYCNRRCTKYAAMIWTNWNSDWERSGLSWIMLSLRQPFITASLIAQKQWCRFCTPSVAIFSHAVINWIHIWRIWMPHLRWDKFWSFFLNNAMAACARWALQVSQGTWRQCKDYSGEVENVYIVL